MRILARLLGCGYLIYLVFNNMIGVPPEEAGFTPTVQVAIIVIFLAAAAALLILSVLEFIKGKKAGVYNESFYTDDPGAFGAEESSDEEAVDETAADKEVDDVKDNNEDS